MTTYKYTIIAPPGSISASVQSINDLGQILGVFTNSSGDGLGFVYSNGVYTTVVPPRAALEPLFTISTTQGR